MRLVTYVCISFNCLSLTTRNTFEIFDFFNLKYMIPDLYFKFVCFFLAVSIWDILKKLGSVAC